MAASLAAPGCLQVMKLCLPLLQTPTWGKPCLAS